MFYSIVTTGAHIVCPPTWRHINANAKTSHILTSRTHSKQPRVNDVRPYQDIYIFNFPIHPQTVKAIPHNSKCRYGERGAAAAKPKAQIILDAAKVSAASGGNSEPKQGQRSQSARGFCPRSTMRVPQPDIIEHFGNADAVPQLPKRCLSRKAGIVRCCLN